VCALRRCTGMERGAQDGWAYANELRRTNDSPHTTGSRMHFVESSPNLEIFGVKDEAVLSMIASLGEA
jgi:hypothetical protein